MILKYAISVSELPENTRSTNVYDQDEDLFIFNTAQERNVFASELQQLNVVNDTLDLIALYEAPQSPLFSDYGFVSSKGIPYLYAHLSSIFAVKKTDENDDLDAALQQMEEHIIGEITIHGRPYYIVDREMQQLIEGIAKAYGITVEWTI